MVADAEDLRRHLGFEKWDVLGNSFGALCVGAYLSFAPEGLGRAFLTGALPHIGWTPDEYNEITLELVDKRCQTFYDAVPYAEENVRKVCASSVLRMRWDNRALKQTPPRLSPTFCSETISSRTISRKIPR